jgi:hypothetical protein
VNESPKFFRFRFEIEIDVLNQGVFLHHLCLEEALSSFVSLRNSTTFISSQLFMMSRLREKLEGQKIIVIGGTSGSVTRATTRSSPTLSSTVSALVPPRPL